MNFPIDYLYRLVDRGGAGLSCDASGVALGSAELARLDLQGGRLRRCEVRSPHALGQILAAAYGPQPDAVVQRLQRGLRRTAAWLEAGDLCHAGVEAVMLRVPELTPTAVAKLAAFADLEKRDQTWKDEPRVPAGQAGGGQWTTDGAGGEGEAKGPAKSVHPARPVPSPRREQLAPTPAGNAEPPPATSPPPPRYSQPQATLDDGVYHYNEGQGSPWIATATPPEETGPYRTAEPAKGKEEKSPFFFGPPPEFGNIEDLFSDLKTNPFKTADWDPSPEFLDYGDLVDDGGNATSIYQNIVEETKAVDPTYKDAARLPEGGIDRLPQADRRVVGQFEI